MADERRDQDMVLAPNEYMFVLDKTKGFVDVFVGPNKQSLSQTDQPVVFDTQKKQFVEVAHAGAKQLVQTAPEGWYIVLKNPAPEGRHPTGTGKQTASNLDVGKKVNIPGPISFPLWPGQMAKVLKGHHLRSNQYLIGRVYDDQAARANWKKAVVKPVASTSASTTPTTSNSQINPGPYSGSAGSGISASSSETPALTPGIAEVQDLIMGQLLIIKGTDVSFYIPPTGVEIIPNDEGELVREAVTLERLEYCLLMDENGNKRYERGPMVVFPEPTEVFDSRETTDGEEPTRKFKALDLNENSGIYIKVIAAYEEGGKKYEVGNELFITGKDQMIYFPREEHAIVKYDKSEIHYGIAIPSGEARYVLDRNTGTIDLVKGPKIFLPDPRHQVVVRRILDWKICDLLYPKNAAAAAHNAALAGIDLSTYMKDGGAVVAAAALGLEMAMNYSGDTATKGLVGGGSPGGLFAASVSLGDSAASHGLRQRSAARGFSGTSVERKTKYTEPRSITLPTKFDGALSVDVWTGYAVKLVTKSGDRRVVQGPQTVLLEYDETPEVMELSSGKPKTTDNLIKTAYLRAKANKVSDLVLVETSDYCSVELKLSYRMNFTGDPEKWFDVENYVKFMCDHLRSRLKSEARKHTIESFSAQSAEIVRSVVVGDDGSGTKFAENGMHVYDVEVLTVKIQNADIEKAIIDAQREIIRSSLRLAAEKRTLAATIESEDVKRQMATTQAQTKAALIELDGQSRSKQLQLDLIMIEANAKVEAERLSKQLVNEQTASDVATIGRERMGLEAEAKAKADSLAQQSKIEFMRAEVESLVSRASAINGDIVSALQAFSDKSLVEKITEAIAPMSLLGGGSVTDILAKVFQGTSLAKHLAALPASNGSGAQARS